MSIPFSNAACSLYPRKRWWTTKAQTPIPKNPFVCPRKGIGPPTFLFFSDGIGTRTNPIRSGGVRGFLGIITWNNPKKIGETLNHQGFLHLAIFRVINCAYTVLINHLLQGVVGSVEYDIVIWATKQNPCPLPLDCLFNRATYIYIMVHYNPHKTG